MSQLSIGMTFKSAEQERQLLRARSTVRPSTRSPDRPGTEASKQMNYESPPSLGLFEAAALSPRSGKKSVTRGHGVTC